jgi:hypothetical protein
MAKQVSQFSQLLIFVLLASSAVVAQQTPNPLTNDDVITMVKSGMPESVVVSAIQSRPGKFSVSTPELVRLHKAGVTENELNAMIATQSHGSASQPAGAAPVAAPTAPKSRKPMLSVTSGNSTQELQLEKTQLAETKTKPSSMKSLASDSVVTQAMEAGVNEVGTAAAMHMNYGVGGESVQQAGSIFSGVLSHRQPKMTYVWGVSGPSSSNVLQSATPSFVIDFSRVLGVTPDDYTPAIVQLTPAQNTCRIIGATQGKADARSSPAADWQIYSNFLEERVNSQVQKLAPGKYKISPSSELAAGEYGVVLRPVSKSKSFSGGDVARGQGDGLLFDAIWTFQISEAAQ